MVYRAAYKNIDRLKFLSRYIVRIPSENLKSLFSGLIPRYFLWNILANHLGNILVYWSRFIPTLFLGNLLALHRDNFITMETLEDRIVYQAVFSNLFLLWNLSILLDIVNLAWVISLNVSLHLISDLLHLLLHAIALLLWVLIALVP